MKIASFFFAAAFSFCWLSSDSCLGQMYYYRIWNTTADASCESDMDCLLAVARTAYDFTNNGNTFDPSSTNHEFRTACPGATLDVECPSVGVDGDKPTYTYYLTYCCAGVPGYVTGTGTTPELAAIDAGIQLDSIVCDGEFCISGGQLDAVPDLGDLCMCIDPVSYPVCPTACYTTTCQPICSNSCVQSSKCKPTCNRRRGFLRRLFCR